MLCPAGAGLFEIQGATRSGLFSPQPRDYAQLVEAIDRAETIRGTQEYINFLGNALRQQVPRLVLNAELKRDLVMRLEFLQVPLDIFSAWILLHIQYE